MSIKKNEIARKIARTTVKNGRKTPEGDTFSVSAAKKFAAMVKLGAEQFCAEAQMKAEAQRQALRAEAAREAAEICAAKKAAILHAARGPLVTDARQMRLACISWVRAQERKAAFRSRLIAEANAAFAKEVVSMTKTDAKRESVLAKLEAELWSRGRYEKVSIFTFREKKTKDKKPTGEAWWRFVEELRAPGMIDLYLQAENKCPPSEQNWFHVENQLPKDGGSAFPRRFDIPNEAWDCFAENEHVLLCSKTVAWSRETKAFNILKEMFPLAIDFRAYSASLTSPVLPNSFGKYNVVVKELLNADGTAPMGVDGSGRAHPSIWGEFSRQVRIMGSGHWRRVFGKGVIVPDERCVDANGNPEIWLDIGQIKGAKKDDLKKIVKNGPFAIEVYISCISEWRNSKTTKLSFEQIQQFAETPRTKALLRKWLVKAYEQALKNGPEALLTQAIEDEENLQLQRKLASLMKVHGTQKCISGLQMSHLRNLMQGRLEKSLYFFAQGAGKMGVQMVCVMDNDVKPGTIVYRNAPIGTQVVVYRFPTLLSQGVRALTCAEPMDHHKVNGKVVFATAYMNPFDLVDCMQGDDDGDIIGVIDDQDLVECMQDKLANTGMIALVESKPESKRDAMMDKPEGQQFVMEPVSKMEIGTYTNHQAKMYAIGDMAAVFALAPCIQDATDAPKKVLVYTNPYVAANRNNWIVHPDKGVPFRYCPGSKDPTIKGHSKLVKQFVLDRMEAQGLVVTDEDGTRYEALNVTPWKKTSKRINAEQFAPLRVEGEFQGNIVWYCHDEAARIWISDYKAQYTLSDLPEINWKLQADSLAELLAKRFAFVPHARMTWLDYQKTLRTPKGLADYGIALHEASQMGKEEGMAHINRAQEKLMLKLQDLTIHELESIWFHEMYYSDKDGNVNHPWTALCHPGSQLMQKLGLTPESCDHMNERRLEHVMEIVKETTNPHRALVEIVRTDNSHANALHTNLWECKCCMKRLSDAFVRHYRSEQTEKSNKLPKHMVSNVLTGSWKFRKD